MSENRTWLRKLTLSGYKSFDTEGQSIEFGDITVLLGANGSGKSNLISFFKLLNSVMTGKVHKFVVEQGYASSLLHYGAKRTQQIQGSLTFETNSSEIGTFKLTLTHISGDLLALTEEKIVYKIPALLNESGKPGTELKEVDLLLDLSKVPKRLLILAFSGPCRVFQFHDTSTTSRIKSQCYIEDNSYIHDDGGNLAPFLYRMKNNDETRPYYERIVQHIKTVFPQFDDFTLEPSENPRFILLNWKETDQDYLLGPHQLSDGTLRFMALTTLLLQPPKNSEDVIIIDEPELGLHPTAINELAGMITLASQYSQIIIATQSPQLVDEFEAEDIVVVERDETDKHTILKRLDEQELTDWLQRYSLSELWEKNVFGGRP